MELILIVAYIFSNYMLKIKAIEIIRRNNHLIGTLFYAIQDFLVILFSSIIIINLSFVESVSILKILSISLILASYRILTEYISFWLVPDEDERHRRNQLKQNQGQKFTVFNSIGNINKDDLSEDKHNLLDLFIYILKILLAIGLIYLVCIIFDLSGLTNLFVLFNLEEDIPKIIILLLIVGLFILFITSVAGTILTKSLSTIFHTSFSDSSYNYEHFLGSLDRTLIFFTLVFEQYYVLLSYYFLKALLKSRDDRESHDVFLLANCISIIIALLSYMLFDIVYDNLVSIIA